MHTTLHNEDYGRLSISLSSESDTAGPDLQLAGNHCLDGLPEGANRLEDLRCRRVHGVRQNIFVGCFEQVQLIPMRLER